MRRSDLVLAACLAVLMTTLGACDARSTSTGARQAPPTATPQTPTTASGACPPAWQGWPDASASILDGLVALPPRTRVVFVDSAPGAADAALCTLDLTAGEIDQFMKTNLPAKDWRYDTTTGKWRNGPVV